MNARPHLLVRCRSWLCAIPLSEVVETLRALPLQPVGGAPTFVRGLSQVRGELLPVVELAALLSSDSGAPAARLVIVRAGQHHLALAVDDVLRVVKSELPQGTGVAPLLSQALPEQVAALATLDGAALLILQSTRLLSEEAWALILRQLTAVGP
ncbi:MAG: chemotaxis protein CheW [Verrucomicrobiota bacterium]